MNDETLMKVVDWVVLHRRGNAFKDRPHNNIANEIKTAIANDVFVISLSNNGTEISGIACGEKNTTEHFIFIHDVLTLRPGIVKEFIIYCMNKHPGYPIYGMAHGRYRLIQNPAKFITKLK